MPTKKAIARPSLPELEELLYSSSNPFASQILAKSDKDWGKAVRTHPAMKKEAKMLTALVRGIHSGLRRGLRLGLVWVPRPTSCRSLQQAGKSPRALPIKICLRASESVPCAGQPRSFPNYHRTILRSPANLIPVNASRKHT